jgi:hypothetical protein
MTNGRVALALNAVHGAATPLLGTMLVFGLLALTLVPWQPAMPASSLDPSWKSVVEWAYLESRHAALK